MKLELLKETKWNGDVWYSIVLDGKYIFGSGNEQNILGIYENAVHDPVGFFEPKIEILLENEINIDDGPFGTAGITIGKSHS